MKADDGLALADRSIDQIAASAAASKRAFLEAAQLGGVEVTREPLSQPPVWSACASEWGRGPGFKLRVADHLESWFVKEAKLKDRLEQMINGLWEQVVIAPLDPASGMRTMGGGALTRPLAVCTPARL